MYDTDPDVRRLWSAMLDDTVEPALPSAQEAVSAARRRSLAMTGAAVAGGTAVLSVAGIVAGATVFAAGPGRAPAPPPVVAAATASASTAVNAPPLPAAPSRDAAHEHGERNAVILAEAVPGRQIAVVNRSTGKSPASTWSVQGGGEYVSTVQVVVTDGTADGLVSASISGGLPGLGADPCAPAVKTMLGLTGCTVTSVGGIPVGVGSVNDPDRGTVTTAVRMLDGGLLWVEAAQRIPGYSGTGTLPPDARPESSGSIGGRPGLSAAPLTEAQATALVANPDLLP